MDLIKDGETRAFVTVHLGGDPAVQAASILIRKFQDKTGVELDLKHAVGYDDITRCLQISISSTAGYEVTNKDLTTPDIQGRQLPDGEAFVADLARIGKDVGLVISAPDLGCLVSATGEILRGMEFSKGNARIVALPPKLFRPDKEVRGVHLTMPAGGDYSSWPEDEMRELFEEWAVWGINTIMMRYQMHLYRSDFRLDPGGPGSAILRRHQALAKIAREFGMKAGLVSAANDSYIDRAVVQLRAHGSAKDCRRAGSPTLLCPSTHQGRSFLMEDREMLFRDIYPVDAIWLWPFEPGGCWCERCDPWVKTFMGLSQEFARSLKRYHTHAQAFVHTHWFAPEDFDLLDEYLDLSPDWLDGIVLDETNARGGLRSMAELKRLASRFSARTRVVFSANISSAPFAVSEDLVCRESGRLGVSPRIDFLMQQYGQLASQLSGIAPMSETVADDIAKVACCHWGWKSGGSPEDVIRKYWYSHFDATGDAGVELVRALDANPTHGDPEAARQGRDALEAASREISPERREQWRWRVFEARVELDERVAAVEPAQQALADLAAELKTSLRSPTKARLVKALSDGVERLTERQKLVEELVQASDELQKNLYRIGPDRELAVNGYQLAEDCGRGSAKPLIGRLQAAAKLKTQDAVKEAVGEIARDLGEMLGE